MRGGGAGPSQPTSSAPAVGSFGDRCTEVWRPVWIPKRFRRVTLRLHAKPFKRRSAMPRRWQMSGAFRWRDREPGMRFKLDENLPVELVDSFSEAGHDAMTVLDQVLNGVQDPDPASICIRYRRTIVTFDTDIADIHTYPPSAIPGLIVLRLEIQARLCFEDRFASA